jgi:amino acid transporter
MKKNKVLKKKSDHSQFAMRFGCGFLIGILIAGSASIVYSAQTMGALILAWVIFALVCGLLAAIFGDKFWQSIIHWIK